jgi:hypothetical protein
MVVRAGQTWPIGEIWESERLQTLPERGTAH